MLEDSAVESHNKLKIRATYIRAVVHQRNAEDGRKISPVKVVSWDAALCILVDDLLSRRQRKQCEQRNRDELTHEVLDCTLQPGCKQARVTDDRPLLTYSGDTRTMAKIFGMYLLGKPRNATILRYTGKKGLQQIR